jgi:valyl-tRNA synthetase
LDDLEQDTFLNYVAFTFEDGKEALIATTRPELLGACVALYANSNDPRYKAYIGKQATVPLFGHTVPVLADDEVQMEFGTGLMMVCTWGDAEDVSRWKRDKLPVRAIISKKGILTDLSGPYKGLSIKGARKKVIEDLKAKGLLKKQEAIKNVCNVHERCGTIAEFVITPQWFIEVVSHAKDWVKRGEEVQWFPQFMKTKYDAWVEGLKWDWCISRQRYYGVPFPVWHCVSCGKVVLPEDKDLPVQPAEDMNKAPACQACGGKDLKPEEDVMDTWMTSSLTPLINAYWQYPSPHNLMEKIYPMSLRVQAFEIIRTWLFYTIVKSHYHTDSLPWRQVMISGWGLDTEGRKISKSLGNFVEPETILEKYSADALRYWTAGASLGQNLRYSEEEVKVGKKTVTKLWNAAKFCLIYLQGYVHNPEMSVSELDPTDRWFLGELQKTITAYSAAFDAYEYSKAKDVLSSFFWQTFCDNYLELIKPRARAMTEGKPSPSLPWTLYTGLLSILKLYAPIMPFVTEEIYQGYFLATEKTKSIHLTSFPTADGRFADANLAKEFTNLLDLVSAIRKFKSLHGYSLKRPLQEVIIDAPKAPSLEAYFGLLASMLSIGKITEKSGAGDLPVNDSMKIAVVDGPAAS